ncbi:uncharacterized protein LOC123439753 [Hordeum vulgare subsp. vulgare]|uniref:uncharacterized protein LOC123439753 n=1 Tax=Hordeum vulgare subsp. vulgare TaxID=112509 RepID=UPI000B46D1BD|nr:uncharacterized protein LOC123439753 [Hordeum vulgare subsp. vulgare]
MVAPKSIISYPQDKAIKRYSVKNIVAAEGIRNFNEACVLEGYHLPKIYIKERWCIGCAIHRKEIGVRARKERKTRAPPGRLGRRATNYGDAEMGQNIFSFVISVIESAIKVWHDTGKVDAKVNFLLDDQKTHTEKYAPVVNIEKAFESTHTHSSCFAYLRQYSEESFLKAACMVAPKSIISYPQVWKGQGSRKWKLDQSDGFFVQFESPNLRKIWFVASTTEKGRALCRRGKVLFSRRSLKTTTR